MSYYNRLQSNSFAVLILSSAVKPAFPEKIPSKLHYYKGNFQLLMFSQIQVLQSQQSKDLCIFGKIISVSRAKAFVQIELEGC